MSNWWKYALVGAGCSFITGLAGVGGMYLAHQRGHHQGYEEGYHDGYEESEPEMFVMDYETHGIEGMCVVRNAQENICAADVDYNGSVDVVLLDAETQQVKEVLLGKDDCASKYLRRLEELKELQKQELTPL